MGDKQSGAAESRPSRVRRARQFVGARSKTEKVGGVAGVLLLLTAPFGGLNEVPAPPPEKIVAKTTFSAGPFDVKVHKVVSLPDIAPTVKPSDPANQLVVVDADVKNVSDRPETVAALRKMVSISGKGIHDENGKPQLPEAYIVADGSQPSEINPGVGYRLALIVEQRRSEAGTKIDFRVANTRFVTESKLTLDEDFWLVEDGVAAHGTFPVEAKR